jgi:hypothetical protein
MMLCTAKMRCGRRLFCSNTDWGLLLASKANILNLDEYSFPENPARYSSELRAFPDRGGAVCWGIVPNN